MLLFLSTNDLIEKSEQQVTDFEAKIYCRFLLDERIAQGAPPPAGTLSCILTP